MRSAIFIVQCYFINSAVLAERAKGGVDSVRNARPCGGAYSLYSTKLLLVLI